jgi:hypothetical protein
MLTRLALFAALAVAATASAAPAPPTETDFNAARIAAASPDKSAQVQCIRFRNLQCQPAAGQPDAYSCSYEEIGDKLAWTRKSATLAWKDGRWTLAGGDPPRCAVLGGAMGGSGAGAR